MSIEDKREKFAKSMREIIEDQDFKKITNPEAIKTYIKDQEDLLEAFNNKKKPTPDIMGVTRGSCSACIKQCECYEPFEVFLLDLSEQSYSNTFIPTLCRNCKCSAYLHPPVTKELNFPKDLKEGLRNTILKEDHLNFSGILAVFDINYTEIDKGFLYKEQEDKLYDLLKHGGFSVISRVMKILNNEEKQNLKAQQTSPNDFFSAVVSQAAPKTSENFKKTANQTGWVKQNEPLLMLCLSAGYINSQSQFCKFMKAAFRFLPVGFKCIYASQSPTQGFTDCSFFFPEVFTVKKYCVLIPTESQVRIKAEIDPIMSFFKTQSLKLKGKMIDDDKDVNLQRLGKIVDQLNYNGFSLGLNSSFKVANVREFQDVLEKFLTVNRAEYLSKFIMANASDLQLNVIAAGKIGIPLMISLPGQSMDSFTFTNEKEIFHLYSYLCPEMTSSSRSLLIFRPIAVRSGLDKIFLNVFKNNYFAVLAQEFKKLTQSEVELIHKDSGLLFQDLLEFMTEGECHVVAVAKLAGFYEAKMLANGCQFGRRRSEKRLLQNRNFVLRHNRERNPFNLLRDEDVGLEPNDPKFINEDVQVRQHLEEGYLFNLSPFSSLTECVDLESIVDKQINSMRHELDLPNFTRKQQQINKLRYFSRHFNILLHTSASVSNSEAEISRFFPHLTLYSDVILVMKAEAVPFEQDFFNLLKYMKCKVIRGCTLEGRNYYHICKLAAREEFLSLFTFHVPVSSIILPQNLAVLFDLLALPAEFENSFGLISFQLKNLSFLDFPTLQQETLLDTLRYALLVTSFEDLDLGPEWVYVYPEFLHFAVKVNTQQKTSKEIRIRKLVNRDLEDPILETLELFDEYSVISWYYKEISKYFPKIVPETFWFKIEPAERGLPVTRVFTCSEFKGFVFLKPIWQMMVDNRSREIKKNKDRGSLVTFMWGRKLALLVERIELIKGENIQDFGPIYWNGKGEYLGSYNGDYLEFDQKKYEIYLNQLREGWEEYAPVEVISEILTKFQVIFASEALVASRKPENMALVPELVEFINLRVFSYKEQPDLSGVKYFDTNLAALNELYNKTVAEMETKDFALVDTFPAKYHKRHFAGNIVWLLSVYLKYFDKKDIELGVTDSEYQIFLESLKQGFLKNYEGDVGVKGISLLQLEYFLFSLTMSYKLLIDIIETQEKRDSVNLGSFDANDQLKKLRQEEDRLSRNLSIQLQEMAEIDLTYKPKAGEDNYLKIDRERYFLHYMIKEYEVDLKHARYPNKIIKAKFPRVEPVLEQFVRDSLSMVQKSWFNPISPSKQNLRPVPKTAFRFDSILVKSTKWMTHERQRKLIRDAMTYLTQTATKFNFK